MIPAAARSIYADEAAAGDEALAIFARRYGRSARWVARTGQGVADLALSFLLCGFTVPGQR